MPPTTVDNYYALLLIAPSATEDEVKAAIKSARRLWIGRQNSPDHERRIEAERNVKALDDAERVLLSADSRARYDRDLENRSRSAEAEERGAEQRTAPDRGRGTDATEWVERANKYLEEGSVHAALRAATEAISEDKGSAEAWEIRGRAYLAGGKVEDAEFDFLQACHLDPKNVYLYIDLADCRCRMRRFDAAFAALQDAYGVAPDSYDVHTAMADCYATSGNPQMAVDLLDKLVSANPNNLGYRTYLALMLVRTVEDTVTRQHSDGSYTYASKQQIETGDAMLTRAASLVSSQEEANAVGITDARQFLERMRGRAFSMRGPSWKWWLGSLAVILIAVAVGGIGVKLIALALLAGWVFIFRETCFPPRYKRVGPNR